MDLAFWEVGHGLSFRSFAWSSSMSRRTAQGFGVKGQKPLLTRSEQEMMIALATLVTMNVDLSERRTKWTKPVTLTEPWISK